jgi:uncharacterized protein (DUF433 family)
MNMDWRSRITIDPTILVGKPIIKDTRIAVEFVLELLANGWAEEAITENYPQLKKEDIQAALRYATDILKEEMVYSYP